MRAIILAAGSAQRLKPLTNNTPKCLLKVGTETILGRNLKFLERYRWSDITIVTGFCGEQIESYVKSSSLPIHCVQNKDFATTNNAYSLKLALDAETSPFVLFDGDMLFDPTILDSLLKSPVENAMVIDSDKTRLNSEAMKAKIDANDNITGLLKSYSIEESVGEYIGLCRFGKVWTQNFIKCLNEMTKKEFENSYYEDAINRILITSPPLSIIHTKNKFWAEVDTVEDLENTKKLLCQ